MISSIDYLRSEVMRLAVALSNETKKENSNTYRWN